MSAQVTEAHRELARDVIFSVKAVAQLIADSEARAVAEWQDFVHLKGQSIDSLLMESNRLRAEVERLKRDYDYDHKCLHEVRERCELWKQRAERAEAKVRVLREALQALRDQQNNADRPLCRAHWQEAMDEACAAIAATEEKL